MAFIYAISTSFFTKLLTLFLHNVLYTACGNSSVGRAQPCQGWGREFESRFPLQILKEAIARSLFSFLRTAFSSAGATPWALGSPVSPGELREASSQPPCPTHLDAKRPAPTRVLAGHPAPKSAR